MPTTQLTTSPTHLVLAMHASQVHDFEIVNRFADGLPYLHHISIRILGVRQEAIPQRGKITITASDKERHDNDVPGGLLPLVHCLGRHPTVHHGTHEFDHIRTGLKVPQPR